MIFVDNSGIDIVLGVLPFARQLLLNNTNVILSANLEPTLNDITHNELMLLLKEASKKCKIIEDALKNGRLMAISNGQSGPCLDLRNLSPGTILLENSDQGIIYDIIVYMIFNSSSSTSNNYI